MYHKLSKSLNVSSQTPACFTLKVLSLTAHPYDSTMALPCGCTVAYDSVRAEMKRVLKPNERLEYRGFTISAMTGLKFDELFGINTAEELITAELYGQRAVPSNDPGNCYLFSSGRGKTARYNSKYFQSIRDMPETKELKAARAAYIPETMEELHNQYLNFQIPSAPEDLAFVEAQLTAVAIDSVAWWTEFVRLNHPRTSNNVAIARIEPRSQKTKLRSIMARRVSRPMPKRVKHRPLYVRRKHVCSSYTQRNTNNRQTYN